MEFVPLRAVRNAGLCPIKIGHNARKLCLLPPSFAFQATAGLQQLSESSIMGKGLVCFRHAVHVIAFANGSAFTLGGHH